MSDLDVSHGRGGAGNIGPESVKYTDGEVVRAGPEGSHDDGPYSTGRGGVFPLHTLLLPPRYFFP